MKFIRYIVLLFIVESCVSPSKKSPMIEHADFSILEVEYLGWNIHPIPDRPDYLSISYQSDEKEENTVWYDTKKRLFSPGDSMFIAKASSVLSSLNSLTESWDCKFISFISVRTESHYYYSLKVSNKNGIYKIFKTDMYEEFGQVCDRPLNDGWYLRAIDF